MFCFVAIQLFHGLVITQTPGRLAGRPASQRGDTNLSRKPNRQRQPVWTQTQRAAAPTGCLISAQDHPARVPDDQ